MTFYDGATELGTASLTTSGGVTSASVSAAFTSLGTHSLSAVYGGDADSAGSVSRDVNAVAGSGLSCCSGYSGDGGPATAALLDHPAGVAVDANGDLFIADTGNNVIREVTPAGLVSTVAGNGSAGYSGDGGPATAAQLRLGNTFLPFGTAQVVGLAVDAHGDLFIADAGNGAIREVSPNGTITTVVNGLGVLPAWRWTHMATCLSPLPFPMWFAR